MQSMHVLYLHGFASSPQTAKGLALGQRLAGAVTSYGIPDLEGGDFRSLTMDGILVRAEAALQALPADGQPVLLIGSSLGGYAAALLAAQERAARVAALLLIAPAFGFTTRWTERLGGDGIAAWRRDGERMFFHHAAKQDLPLGVGFYDSCLALPELPAQAWISLGDQRRHLPVTIVHGRQDETVDHRASVQYALQRTGVDLHLVTGDHRLTDQRHETLIAWCALDLLARTTAARSTAAT